MCPSGFVGAQGTHEKGCQMVETEPSLFYYCQMHWHLLRSGSWNLLAVALRGVALIWLRPGPFWYLWLCLLPFPIFVAAKGRLLSGGHDYEPALATFRRAALDCPGTCSRYSVGLCSPEQPEGGQFFKHHLSGIDLESSVQDL